MTRIGVLGVLVSTPKRFVFSFPPHRGEGMRSKWAALWCFVAGRASLNHDTKDEEEVEVFNDFLPSVFPSNLFSRFPALSWRTVRGALDRCSHQHGWLLLSPLFSHPGTFWIHLVPCISLTTTLLLPQRGESALCPGWETSSCDCPFTACQRLLLMGISP